MNEPLYHLQAVNNRTGHATRLTRYAATHAQACTMKSKFSIHSSRRIELVEAQDGDQQMGVAQ